MSGSTGLKALIDPFKDSGLNRLLHVILNTEQKWSADSMHQYCPCVSECGVNEESALSPPCVRHSSTLIITVIESADVREER